MDEKCFFCTEQDAEFTVMNKVGAKVNACRSCATIAVDGGWSIVLNSPMDIEDELLRLMASFGAREPQPPNTSGSI